MDLAAAQHGPAASLAVGEALGQPVAVKQVIAEHQRGRIGANKATADNERLRQPFRPGLLGIAQRQPPLAAIAEQTPKGRQIDGRGDDQDVANAGQHQG